MKIKEVFGFDVHVFIRTKNEFQRIINDNPFKEDDISKLHVTFLSDFTNCKHVKEIDEAKNELEKYFFSDSEIYLYLPNGYARTKLTNDFFEKKLGFNAKTRNWRTVNNLLDITKSL
jgi:uncharacterized protein (DUF1697 family)